MQDMNDDKRHQGSHQNRRHRGSSPHRRHRPHGSQSGGSRQRPLLTSAITAAGLSLVALCVSVPFESDFQGAQLLLAGCLIAFTLSAFVSYFAQRFSDVKVVEKVSDVFFLTGAVLFVILGLVLGGFVAPLPSMM